MTFLKFVSGSCMETRRTPLIPKLRFKWLVKTGSKATRLINDDSEGVTWEMMDVKIAFFFRVIAVTSM